MKDIDFDKVKYPEFIKHHSFDPNIRIDGGIYRIERKMSALAIEEKEKIITERIIEIAKEHGITDLYLLNKKNILEALQKQIPKKPVMADEKFEKFAKCPCCSEILGLWRPWVKDYLYCFKCGQALDWGQEE